MSNNINQQSQQVALKVWEVVKDPKLLRKVDLGVTLAPVVNTANRVADYALQGEPSSVPRDVLIVAKFISNLEPSYRSPKGIVIHLRQIRGVAEFTDEKLNYLIDKFRVAVEHRISVTSGEESLTHKLKVNSKLSKKVLIQRAVRHLLSGSEVTKDVDVYNVVKFHSLLKSGYINDYLHLAGLANLLRFNSVADMMDAFVLDFQDQEESIKETGLLTFYNVSLTRVPIGG